MSPDEPRTAARDALARASDRFRSALATTIDQLRGMLPDDGDAEDLSALGSFAAGRIDPARFAAAVVRRRPAEAAATATVERALDALTALAERGDDLTRLALAPGADLHAAVDAALARVGRAFAAARAVAARREESVGEPFPFARWNRTERGLAPPLVIELDGADLHADGLAEFLDGALRVALLVRGPAPPAPLARLVSPGVFVLQTGEAADLARLAAWDGPGVAAVLPEGAARFVHDPAAGATLAERLVVAHRPEAPPAAAVGGISVAQQREQLAVLAALADRPAAPPTAPDAPAASDDPAGKLAAWMLSAADLTDLP